MSIQMKRKYGNKSSINFASFRQAEIDPQIHKIYRKTSQMSQLMNDYPERVLKTSTKLSQNIITSTTEHYQAPVYEQGKKRIPNKDYLQFFDSHKSFVKPYGSNTKYIDMINKNKALLRNNMFQVSTLSTKDLSLQKKNMKKNRTIKFYRHTQKTLMPTDSKNIQNIPTETSRPFDKTISTQLTVYKTLFNKQRSLKSQCINLNNSLNRILAAESITQQLYPRSRNFQLTETN